VSSKTKGVGFARALLHQWWLLLLPVLGLISTAVTFVVPLWPQFHLHRFLVFGLSFILLLAAFYRVFSGQYDSLTVLGTENDSLKREIAESHGKCGAFENEVVVLKTEIANSQSEVLRLRQEVDRLSIRPYDEQKKASARATLALLSSLERDLLRFLLMNGECRTDVIYLNRQQPEIPFDINALQQAWRCGLAVRNDDDSPITGFSRYSINPTWHEVLNDLLFPRDEIKERQPLFKGIGS
jgi:hypothetical protein